MPQNPERNRKQAPLTFPSRSADCHHSATAQAPALQRVLEARRDTITIVDVDATTDHSLVQTYHVLTVPGTVLLDAQGNIHAVNYGFAPTQLLLTQVDTVLAKLALPTQSSC